MASTILTILGTRPEVIKMSPVLRLLKKAPSIDSRVCVTAQQASLLPQMLSHLCINVDYALEPSNSHDRLLGTIAGVLDRLDTVLTECAPELVLVQGDTTSALAGALAASYREIPVGHIEAGLRTGNLSAPFPEELNRQLISRIARYHFATTTVALNNLLDEGIQDEMIWVTGSTVIDALKFSLNTIRSRPRSSWTDTIPDELLRRISDQKRPLVLITGHRRENLDSGIASVCRSISHLANLHPDWHFVFPVHPNPRVREPAYSELSRNRNIILTPPMNYTEFVFTMAHSSLIITDSGGIQEEAPFLNVPLLVTRDGTERVEGVDAGVAAIVGSHPDQLIELAEEMICTNKPDPGFCRHSKLYGDGKASWRLKDLIIDLMQDGATDGIAVQAT